MVLFCRYQIMIVIAAFPRVGISGYDSAKGKWGPENSMLNNNIG